MKPTWSWQTKQRTSGKIGLPSWARKWKDADTMTEWERVESLFHQALALPEDERPGFLDRECQGDSNLRQEISSLLLHHREQLVQEGDVPSLLRELELGLPILEEGTHLGPYVIVR